MKCLGVFQIVHAGGDCEDVEAKIYTGEYGDWLRASPIRNIIERSASEKENERQLLKEMRGEREEEPDEKEKNGRCRKLLVELPGEEEDSAGEGDEIERELS